MQKRHMAKTLQNQSSRLFFLYAGITMRTYTASDIKQKAAHEVYAVARDQRPAMNPAASMPMPTPKSNDVRYVDVAVPRML